MNSKAIKFIEYKLSPMIAAGRKIERIAIYISSKSEVAHIPYLQTTYGQLRICTKDQIPLGVSYLMEDPGEVGRAFSWIKRSRPFD